MFHSEYITPQSLHELLTVLNQCGEDARVIAGCTDLVPQMRLGLCAPRLLVDSIRLPQAGIIEENGSVHLGARVTHSHVVGSSILAKEFPALRTACQQVGGPPVRNRGTLAGNLVNASPAADSAPPLLVYDTQIIAISLNGERVIPLDQFFLGPGRTCLTPVEFVNKIYIPKVPHRSAAAFLKLGNRNAMAVAVASVAVRLTVDETGTVKQARVALGSVAPTPLRALQAEAILQSGPLNEETFVQAALAASSAASPISDLRASADYRRKMVAVLTRRALEQACALLASRTFYE